MWACAPYAAIYDGSRFEKVTLYPLFQTMPATDRRAAIMKFRMRTPQRDLVVVCNHSPKSKKWNACNNATVLRNCVEAAEKAHGAGTPVPRAAIMCGDFNIFPNQVYTLM